MSIFLLIFFILMLIYSFLIDFYRRAWNQVPVYDIDDVKDVKVSVIIAVRNEEMNISDLVTLLGSQGFPKALFEVIFVDDHSEDNTLNILKGVNSEHLSLIILQLPDGISSKKKAIEYGIRSANGELIITTDADCRMGPLWIKSYASCYKKTGAKFIAAPVIMETHNSFRDIFQSLDFIAMQAITGASVHKRFHTMCNGANLAYTKMAFIEANGFEGIDEIPSGDDMLLMHKIYSMHPDKVLYMKNKEAIVTTHPETSWKNFIHQRIRWASKAAKYDDKRILPVLLIVYLFNLCFLALFMAGFWNYNYWLYFLAAWVLKTLVEFPLFWSVADFFNKRWAIKFFFFFQPLHIFYTIISGLFGQFGKYEWKGRKVR